MTTVRELIEILQEVSNQDAKVFVHSPDTDEPGTAFSDDDEFEDTSERGWVELPGNWMLGRLLGEGTSEEDYDHEDDADDDA